MIWSKQSIQEETIIHQFLKLILNLDLSNIDYSKEG
jgi:hypothetical protein